MLWLSLPKPFLCRSFAVLSINLVLALLFTPGPCLHSSTMHGHNLRISDPVSLSLVFSHNHFQYPYTLPDFFYSLSFSLFCYLFSKPCITLVNFLIFFIVYSFTHMCIQALLCFISPLSDLPIFLKAAFSFLFIWFWQLCEHSWKASNQHFHSF
jgi:hypothetical protein